ncbi:hypothetical protein DW726_07530 [Streptococcus gordonii]|uniref:hypothetical protein n=1 Tax=Streptococcus gordonii TaxID=1302 RepID=UPI000E54605A|nr:hypothetical protein [Streptococcus gordonii]RHE63998.1 hypothetical protein DW726_07530 [Streptococcus gordonii]
MKKVKFLLKNHWKLLVFEFVPITIYVFASIFINKNTIQDSTILSIVFSAEFVVSILIAIGAIYSWLQSKDNLEYEKKLQILKDIDDIREFYKGKKDELEIIKKCQVHIDVMRDEFKDSSDEFLVTYIDYVSSKFESEEESYVDTLTNIENKNSDNSNSKTLREVKEDIASKIKVNDTKLIRYSKNYESVALESGYNWIGWYNLRKSFLDNYSEKGSKLIFFTKVGEEYKGCQIDILDLKRVINKMTPRNSKNGDPQYDFYICQNKDNSFSEKRNDINLSEYGANEVMF